MTGERMMLLNELSQGRRPLAEGLAWFESLPVDERRAVIRELAYYIVQAKATRDEVEVSIGLAGVKPGVTPSVLLSRGPLGEQLAKVGNLPEPEMSKSFRILISLLSVADARRRRVDCANGCQHPWHPPVHRPAGPEAAQPVRWPQAESRGPR
jgi:hypothetical protein